MCGYAGGPLTKGNMNNYYPQPDEDAAAPDMASDQETPKKKKDDMSEGESALIPKSLLAGKDFKPGEEVVLKIVRDYGDQIEVQYAADDGSDEEQPDSEEEDPDALPSGPQEGGSEMDQAQARLGMMGS